MNELTNQIITDMFNKHWTGDETLSSIDNMRAQLRESLKSQVDGYWSGDSAYRIMTEGGFLIDRKSMDGKPKKLTAFGRAFIREYDESQAQQVTK